MNYEIEKIDKGMCMITDTELIKLYTYVATIQKEDLLKYIEEMEEKEN